MTAPDLTPDARSCPKPLGSRIFLEGAAGTGKTTAGVGRLRHMLASGIPADQIHGPHPTADLGQAIL